MSGKPCGPVLFSEPGPLRGTTGASLSGLAFAVAMPSLPAKHGSCGRE